MRILIVEDEILVAMLLGDLLEDMGHTIVGPTDNVQNALVLIAQADAAILDVNLHRSNSYVVADALLATGKKFAFATGHGAGGIDPRYQGIPVCNKPFDDDDLTRVVNSLY